MIITRAIINLLDICTARLARAVVVEYYQRCGMLVVIMSVGRRAPVYRAFYLHHHVLRMRRLFNVALDADRRKP